MRTTPLSSASRIFLDTCLAGCLSLFLSLPIAETVAAETYQDGMQAIEITNRADKPSLQTNSQKFNPKTGRQSAAKYMAPKRPTDTESYQLEPEASDTSRAPASGTNAPHYLAISVGSYLSDNSYQWGSPESQENIGRWNIGVSYRMGEWIDSMDLLMRFEVSKFANAEGDVTKFSILPIVTFPDASSRFPLYFGVGAGLGIFGTQLKGESSLALDYQLLAGARFFNLWGMTGLFVEGGAKNHIHIFSDGQFNGTYISTGFLFTF